MSLPEVLLWRELKGKPLAVKFRRQYPVKGYVADFACLEVRLLIEIDGIVHDMDDHPQRDERRDAVLIAHGWRLIRIAAKRVLAEPLQTAEAIVRLAQSLRDERSSPERGGGGAQD
jgi:very-short-patch-repair endonuclease